MKNKTMGILIAAAVIVAIVALFIPYEEKSKEEEITTFACSDTSENQENDTKLNKISCKTYHEKIKEEKDNLILIARPTCSYCQKFIPILEEIIDEYKIEVNYFNTDALSEDEVKSFYESAPLFKSNNFGTPALIVTNNQKIIKSSIGYKEKDDAVKWLKSVGIIK